MRLWCLLFLLSCSSSERLRRQPPPSPETPEDGHPAEPAEEEPTIPSREVVIQTPHGRGIERVEVSRRGRLLMTASSDGSVKLRTPDGRVIRTINTGMIIRDAALSPDGRRMLVGGDAGLAAWTVEGERTGGFEDGHDRGVTSVAYAPNGSRAATAGDRGDVVVWSADGVRQVSIRHPRPVQVLAFSPDGDRLYGGSEDGALTVWSWDGQVVKTIDAHEGALSAIDVARDGRIVTGSRQIKTFTDQMKVKSVRGRERIKIWSANGERLAVIEAAGTLSGGT